MGDAPGRLIDGAAFDAENDVLWNCLADRNDLRPINDAVAAGATDRCARYGAALGVGLLHRNILGVQMNEFVLDLFEPNIRVLTGKVGISRIKIGADGRRTGQGNDLVVQIRFHGVLLVRFDADLDSTWFGNERRFLERVLDEREIFILRRPSRFGAFVGTNNGSTAFRREANRLFEIIDRGVRFAEWTVRRQGRRLDVVLFEDAANP